MKRKAKMHTDMKKKGRNKFIELSLKKKIIIIVNRANGFLKYLFLVQFRYIKSRCLIVL